MQETKREKRKTIEWGIDVVLRRKDHGIRFPVPEYLNRDENYTSPRVLPTSSLTWTVSGRKNVHSRVYGFLLKGVEDYSYL